MIGIEITVGLSYPFGRPDGTDGMRVPVLSSIAVDKGCAFSGEVMFTGEVYRPSDVMRRANERALRENVLVYHTCTSGVLLKVYVALAYLLRDRRRHSRTPILPSASANNSVVLGSGTPIGFRPFWPWLLPFWPWLFCAKAGSTGVVNKQRHTRLVAKIRRIIMISLCWRTLISYGIERRCEAIT